MNTLPPPDLSDAALLRVVSGIRPCRRGGIRLEAEQMTLGARSKTVIHNYGQGGCGVTLSLGCAQLAADLVLGATADPEGAAVPTTPIAILGAGVTALTTARELLSRGHRVTCYATKFATDTTSNIAGAIWLPTGVEFGDRPDKVARFHDILRRSHAAFGRLDLQQWGVQRLPVYEPAYAPHEDRFFDNGTLEPPQLLERLPVAGPPRAGRVFYTSFIHTPRFLAALAADITARGGAFIERTFTAREQLASLNEPVLVNCLALGSRELFDDHSMYPARGVLVHMKPQPLGYIVHDGYKYMFPRHDALVLGGCFDADVEDPTPPEHTVREILDHHRRFFAV